MVQNSQLPSLSELSDLSNVTDGDIVDAIEQWEKNPPDDNFDGILRAEIEDGED